MDYKDRLHSMMTVEREIATFNLIFYAKMKKLYDQKIQELDTISEETDLIIFRHEVELQVLKANQVYTKQVNKFAEQLKNPAKDIREDQDFIPPHDT